MAALSLVWAGDVWVAMFAASIAIRRNR